MSAAKAISLPSLVDSISAHWSPKHLLTVNNSHSIKVAKIQGDFIWHSHPNTDEVFQCISGGPLRLELCTKATSPEEAERMGADEIAELNEGDFFNVPKGMQHRPRAEVETSIMIIEKVGTVNTGDREGDGNVRTVYVDEKL